MKEIHQVDMEKTQYSKLIDELPAIDIVITMGCNVKCPMLPCIYREDWGLADPTGKEDKEFIEIINAIQQKIEKLAARIKVMTEN